MNAPTALCLLDSSFWHNVSEMKGAPSSWYYRYRLARGRPRGLLILLHGYGSNEDDLFGLTPFLDERLHIVSLRASLPLAQEAFAWFPLEFRQDGIRVNPEDVYTALDRATLMVSQAIELAETSPDQTFLLGFSQGAIVSAALQVTQPTLTRGAILLSGMFPSSVLLRERALDKKPIFVAHGLFDAVIPVHRGRELSRWLSDMGAQVTYREYPVAHTVDEAALEDIDRWLDEQLGTP